MKQRTLPPKRSPPESGLLRLFVVTDDKGRPVTNPDTGEVLYFQDKRAAKAQRQPGYTVGVGPDHRRHPEYAR